MSNRWLWLRNAVVLLACALAVPISTAAAAHIVNFSLNVYYTDPHNVLSGGTWDLVAKSSDLGIYGIAANIKNINSTVQNEAPRAIVNGSNDAGFGPLGFFNTAFSDHRAITVGQIPISPLPSGLEQSLFFGVGTLTNGAPDWPGKSPAWNAIPGGPTFTSLTSPQDIPWALGDTLPDAATWVTAARFASGTFATGVTPAFSPGSTANVFASFTYSAPGSTPAADTITTIVRTNFAPGADYNHNGIVDAADYVVWRMQLGTTVPAGSGADGTGDTFVDINDYNLWRSHFGLPFGSGSGTGLSTSGIPEPTSCMLLTIGAMLAIAPRRMRRQAVNS